VSPIAPNKNIQQKQLIAPQPLVQPRPLIQPRPLLQPIERRTSPRNTVERRTSPRNTATRNVFSRNGSINNLEDENKNIINPPQVPPTTPPENKNTPGYGNQLTASPNTFFTSEFQDKDGEGFEDRLQSGPGQEAGKWGSQNEESKDWIGAGKPVLEEWNWDEYKKKKNPQSIQSAFSKIVG
jgi:hypothetical protein